MRAIPTQRETTSCASDVRGSTRVEATLSGSPLAPGSARALLRNAPILKPMAGETLEFGGNAFRIEIAHFHDQHARRLDSAIENWGTPARAIGQRMDRAEKPANGRTRVVLDDPKGRFAVGELPLLLLASRNQQAGKQRQERCADHCTRVTVTPSLPR